MTTLKSAAVTPITGRAESELHVHSSEPTLRCLRASQCERSEAQHLAKLLALRAGVCEEAASRSPIGSSMRFGFEATAQLIDVEVSLARALWLRDTDAAIRRMRHCDALTWRMPPTIGGLDGR